MYADSERELFDFAGRLRLQPAWVQRNASGLVHFDLTEGKRKLAVMYGAVESSDRHMVGYARKGRKAGLATPTTPMVSISETASGR